MARERGGGAVLLFCHNNIYPASFSYYGEDSVVFFFFFIHYSYIEILVPIRSADDPCAETAFIDGKTTIAHVTRGNYAPAVDQTRRVQITVYRAANSFANFSNNIIYYVESPRDHRRPSRLATKMGLLDVYRHADTQRAE